MQDMHSTLGFAIGPQENQPPAPLRAARVIPPPTADEVAAAQQADLRIAGLRNYVTELGVAAFGSEKPVAAILKEIASAPRDNEANMEVIDTLFNPATAPPLKGAVVGKYDELLGSKLGSLFGVKADDMRRQAETDRFDLANALCNFAPLLCAVEDGLKAAHREAQRFAKVEIPAPSPVLAAALRDGTTTKLDPAAAAELSKLSRVISEGLPPADKRLIAKGDLPGLAASTGLPPAAAKTLADTSVQAAQLAKQVQVLSQAQTQSLSLVR
jgi:hypothetical protein